MEGSEQRQPGPGPLASHSHGAELDTRSLGVSKGQQDPTCPISKTTGVVILPRHVLVTLQLISIFS